MTYAEFLEALRRTPRDWQMKFGYIRRCLGIGEDGFDQSQCPLSSLANKRTTEWDAVASDLRMNHGLAREITLAADGYDNDSAYSRRMRGDLLDACGLLPANPQRLGKD